MVHIHGRFWQNTAMCLQATVQKLKTDGRGRFNISCPGPSAQRQIKICHNVLNMSCRQWHENVHHDGKNVCHDATNMSGHQKVREQCHVTLKFKLFYVSVLVGFWQKNRVTHTLFVLKINYFLPSVRPFYHDKEYYIYMTTAIYIKFIALFLSF